MATMTRVQAEALAAYISRVRTDWRPAGIVAALEKAAPTCDVWDVTNAICALARDESVKTPGLLPGPGPHWRKWDGSLPARRGDFDMACVDHPAEVHPCPRCRDEKPRLTAEAIAELRAVVAARRTPTPKFVTPKAAPDADARREQLRQAIEQEAHA